MAHFGAFWVLFLQQSKIALTAVFHFGLYSVGTGMLSKALNALNACHSSPMSMISSFLLLLFQ